MQRVYSRRGYGGAIGKPPETGRETSFGSNLALSVSQAFILVLRSKLSYKSKQSLRPYSGALRSPPYPFAKASCLNCLDLYKVRVPAYAKRNARSYDRKVTVLKPAVVKGTFYRSRHKLVGACLLCDKPGYNAPGHT